MSLAWLLALLSALPMAWLAWGDPKRLRVSGQRQRKAHTPRTRALLATTALLPGVVLLFHSAAAVLIWLGAVTTMGWAISEAFAPRRPARPANGD
ncbi:MAG: hypothetical protein VX549_05740 [Pseudomonadota bacterium]|nr:hypothetical protein [Pseudomonadota bacterium]